MVSKVKQAWISLLWVKVFMFIAVKSETIISDHGKVFMFIAVKSETIISDHGKISINQLINAELC